MEAGSKSDPGGPEEDDDGYGGGFFPAGDAARAGVSVAATTEWNVRFRCQVRVIFSVDGSISVGVQGFEAGRQCLALSSSL